jgi:hypothetical protein
VDDCELFATEEFDAVVFDTEEFDAVVFDTEEFDAVVFDTEEFDAVVWDPEIADIASLWAGDAAATEPIPASPALAMSRTATSAVILR